MKTLHDFNPKFRYQEFPHLTGTAFTLGNVEREGQMLDRWWENGEPMALWCDNRAPEATGTIFVIRDPENAWMRGYGEERKLRACEEWRTTVLNPYGHRDGNWWIAEHSIFEGERSDKDIIGVAPLTAAQLAGLDLAPCLHPEYDLYGECEHCGFYNGDRDFGGAEPAENPDRELDPFD